MEKQDLMGKKEHYNISWFSQINTDEFIYMPCKYPDVEQIVSVIVDYEIKSIKSVDTMKGISYEGVYLSGKKLAIEVLLKQKILYAADKHSQSVHVFENIFYQSVYVVIPHLIKGTDPDVLIKKNLLKCKIKIEDVNVKVIGKRQLYKTLQLFVGIELLPVNEICCTLRYKCRNDDICFMYEDGSHVESIMQGSNYKIGRPVWSPLGRKIAYSFLHNKEIGICLCYVGTKTTSRLISSSSWNYIGDLNWLFNGSCIFFTGFKCGCREIYLLNICDVSLKQLTCGKRTLESFKPKCSSLGQIALLRSMSCLTDLWVMNSDGLNCVQLTNCGNVSNFDWCPNGENIVYISRGKQDNVMKLHIIDIAGKIIKTILCPISVNKIKKILYSPDGQYLAFITRNCAIDNIYVYDLKKGKWDKLTNYRENVTITDFTWSTDSDKIYYAMKDYLINSIYAISLLSNQSIQLQNTSASKVFLSYRPKIS